MICMLPHCMPHFECCPAGSDKGSNIDCPLLNGRRTLLPYGQVCMKKETMDPLNGAFQCTQTLSRHLPPNCPLVTMYCLRTITGYLTAMGAYSSTREDKKIHGSKLRFSHTVKCLRGDQKSLEFKCGTTGIIWNLDISI